MKNFFSDFLIRCINNRNSIACVLTGCIVFVISIIISNMYTLGDQYGYHNAYEMMRGLSWSEAQPHYSANVTSNEPIHFFVLVVGGLLDINKNFFMSVFNGIFAAYAVRLFSLWGGHLWIAIVTVLGNFYFYVLYFAAERVKFAFLFLLLAILFTRKTWLLITTVVASIYSHFSIIFIYSGIFFYWLPQKISIKRKKSIPNQWVAVFIVLTLAAIFFEYEYLSWKLGTYINQRGPLRLVDFTMVSVLMVFSCLYSKQGIRTVLLFLPIVFGIVFLGTGRLNMFAYFIFIYYGFRFNGGKNIGMLLCMIYFTYKNLLFIIDIAHHGEGLFQ